MKKTKIVVVICLIVLILLLAVRQLSTRTTLGDPKGCSANEQWCVYAVVLDGGATTGYFTNVYVDEFNVQSKPRIIGIDKIKPSQLEIKWESSNHLLISVPDCSLLVNPKHVDNLTVDYYEGDFGELHKCNI